MKHKIKYLVISAIVRSKLDGDLHKISCKTLMELYGVNPKECICANEDDDDEFISNIIIHYPKLKILRPLVNGGYQDFLKN